MAGNQGFASMDDKTAPTRKKPGFESRWGSSAKIQTPQARVVTIKGSVKLLLISELTVCLNAI